MSQAYRHLHEERYSQEERRQKEYGTVLANWQSTESRGVFFCMVIMLIVVEVFIRHLFKEKKKYVYTGVDNVGESTGLNHGQSCLFS